MNSIFSRILGFALTVAAIAGLIFSGWGLVRVWTIKNTFTDDVLDTIALTKSTLEATSSGLIVAQDSIDQASLDVISIKNTLEATNRALKATNPVVVSLSDLLENDLPNAIDATITSLNSAQSSAQVIDNFLRTISSIPFLPVEPYNPSVPLNESLASVSDSLESIPGSLKDMEEGLNRSQGNLIVIQAEFSIMARNVERLNTSLSDAKVVVIEYQDVVSEIQTRVDRLETSIPRRINTLAWFLTFFLIWLAITQFGLLAQGIRLLTTPQSEERVETLVVERIVEKEDEEGGDSGISDSVEGD